MSASGNAASFNPTIVTQADARGAMFGGIATFVGPSFNIGMLVQRDKEVAEPIVVTIARQAPEVVTREDDQETSAHG